MNKINKPHFGERIRIERKRLGLSQAEAGRLCGVARETWGKYERGVFEMGGAAFRAFIAAGADADFITTGQQPMFHKALPFGGQIDPYLQPWIPTMDSADEVGKRLAYALNTLTADMAHGFTLVTGYGAIQVAAADAEGFQRLARRMLTHALADHLAARKGQGNGC